MYAITTMIERGKISIATGINNIEPMESKNIPQQHHKKNVNFDT